MISCAIVSASGARQKLARSEEEKEGLRRALDEAQEAADRLRAASAEAEVALEARDAERAALRGAKRRSPETRGSSGRRRRRRRGCWGRGPKPQVASYIQWRRR